MEHDKHDRAGEIQHRCCLCKPTDTDRFSVYQSPISAVRMEHTDAGSHNVAINNLVEAGFEASCLEFAVLCCDVGKSRSCNSLFNHLFNHSALSRTHGSNALQ